MVHAFGINIPLRRLQNNDEEQPAGLRCDFTHVLGEGGYGKVYKGTLHDKEVAVKRCDLKKLYRSKIDPKAEAQLLSKFSGRHRCIIKFYGHYKDANYYHYIMEYCKYGSIFDHLKEQRTTFDIKRSAYAETQRVRVCC